jgi:hypothetical protein
VPSNAAIPDSPRTQTETAGAERLTREDESSFLHGIALFDVAHKYADVLSLDELLAALAGAMEPAAA